MQHIENQLIRIGVVRLKQPLFFWSYLCVTITLHQNKNEKVNPNIT